MTSVTDPTERTTSDRPGPMGSHPVDLLALFFGLGFLGIGAGALADQLGWISMTGRTWLGTLLVSFGTVVVVALVAGQLRRPHPEGRAAG